MKIVLVINTMITNKEKISNIILDEKEIFFLYDNKYIWSIEKINENWSDQYVVNFFPKDRNSIVQEDIEDIVHKKRFGTLSNIATYSTVELKAVEAFESFKDLYQILLDKLYGIDEMFDDILTPPF
jgi:hypothetical protein